MLLNTEGMFEYLPSQHSKIKNPKDQPINIILKQLDTKPPFYLLSAGTGSGKSSLFMVELLNHAKGSIICTQPRVALCKEKMTDIPEHYSQMQKGYNLGYIVGNNQAILPTAEKYILFMTTEKLQQYLIRKDELLKTISYIVVDEVHDISEQMIFLLLTIKQTKPSQTVIFMSATMDIDKLLSYFKIKPTINNIGYIKRQEGKFKKYRHYITSGKNLEQRFVEALKQIYKIPFDQNSKDVLIFCSDKQQIQFMQQVFMKHKPSYKFIALTYMSSDIQSLSDNQAKFEESTAVQKFIFSTNLLQAGSTIPTLLHVVDLGVQLTPALMPLNNEINIIRTLISEGTKEQRIGRVGRVHDGHAWCLYDEKFKFPTVETNPFIINSQQLYDIILKTLKFDKGDHTLKFDDYEMLFKMSTDFINKGIYILLAMNLINIDNHVTEFGQYVLHQGLNIPQILAILCDANFEDLVLISAIFKIPMLKTQTQLQIVQAFYEKNFKDVGQYLSAINQYVEFFLYELVRFYKADVKKFDYKRFIDVMQLI